MSRMKDILRRNGGDDAGDAAQAASRAEPGYGGRIPSGSGRGEGLQYETDTTRSAAGDDKLPWLESSADPFDDDLDTEQPLISKKWLWLGGIAFFSLLALVATGIYLKSVKNLPVAANADLEIAAAADDPRIELIEADKTPIKEAPDPSLNEGTDQNAIYDVADGQNPDSGPTQMAANTSEPAERPVANTVPPLTSEPQNVLPQNVTPVPPLDSPAPAPVAQKPKPAAKPKPVPAIEPVPSLPPAPTPVPAPTPAVVSSGSGGVYLQLGSFSSRERAESAWAQLSGKSGLGGLSQNIVEAGGAFKLRAGPVASASDASNRCAKVKAAGQGCFVAK